jgi:hypothetical protein
MIHSFLRIDFEEKLTTHDTSQIRISRIKSNCKTIENLHPEAQLKIEEAADYYLRIAK